MGAFAIEHAKKTAVDADSISPLTCISYKIRKIFGHFGLFNNFKKLLYFSHFKILSHSAKNREILI